MTRYIKRSVGRRDFGIASDLFSDFNQDYSYRAAKVGVVEARTEYYQGNLVDTMLKILYLERFRY